MTQAQFPDLKDAGVLVTGGGSGIGASLVEAFAMQGARVSFIDIAEEPSLALVKRLATTAQHPVHFFKTDLRNIAAIGKTVEAAALATGDIKVLVSNAAWDDRHDIETVTEAYWDANQAVNLKQMFFSVQAALPYLRQAKGASIVNFSSISFLLNMGEPAILCGGQGRHYRVDEKPRRPAGPENIRVNTLLPGMIVTERQKELWLTDEGITATTARQCLKRTLVAADLAGPCLFLASSASSAITAQSIIVDGGLL